jgi:hypothetical protein
VFPGQAALTTLSHSTIIPTPNSGGLLGYNKLEDLQYRFNNEIDRLIEFIDDGEEEYGQYRYGKRARKEGERSKSRSGNNHGV